MLIYCLRFFFFFYSLFLMSESTRPWRLILFVPTSQSSKKPVLHFSCSNPNIFDYDDLNILGLFGILNKEHQMIFWYKKKVRKLFWHTKHFEKPNSIRQSQPVFHVLRDLVFEIRERGVGGQYIKDKLQRPKTRKRCDIKRYPNLTTFC
jgi:hypothetical protein